MNSDAEEENKKEEMLKIAKKELEDWYKTHEEQIAKTKAANRYIVIQFCLLVLCSVFGLGTSGFILTDYVICTSATTTEHFFIKIVYFCVNGLFFAMIYLKVNV